jgi:hypothetical protein
MQNGADFHIFDPCARSTTAGNFLVKIQGYVLKSSQSKEYFKGVFFYLIFVISHFQGVK